MIKKRFIVILLVMMLPMLPTAPLVEASVDSEQSTDQLTTGTTGGIVWAYNEHKERTFTSSVGLSDEITVAKTVSKSPTYNRNIQLITGTQVVDSFYERQVQFTRRDGAGSPYKQEKGLGLRGTIGNQTGNFNNIFSPGLNAFYRNDWFALSPSSGNAFAQSLIGLAGPFGLGWKTTNVSMSVIQTHEIPLLDLFQKEYGTIFVPEVHFNFTNDVLNTPGNLGDDETILIEKIIPRYQLILIKTQSFPVVISEAIDTIASLSASYNFTGQYTETRFGHEVLISDLDHFVFGWYGLENASLAYDQSGGFTIDGLLQWNISRDITFASNGTAVNEDLRLPWWKSSNMTVKGSWSHAFEDNGTIVGKAALQSVVEAIKTRATTPTTDQLLIWANIIPSTMFGYTDLDNSGDVSIRLNGSVLEILDQVNAIGYAHGLKHDSTYDFTNYVSASSFWQFGNEILTDTNENSLVQDTLDRSVTWGVDPNSEHFSTTETKFNWVTPSEDASGNVDFKWNIEYKDFPTLWNIRNGSSEYIGEIDKMDIFYEYNLEVDSSDGVATLSNTYKNSGFTNPNLTATSKDLSFATYKRDLFLGLQKAVDTADSTESGNKATISTSMAGANVIDQTFGGTKKAYSLGDLSTHDSQTTVVNVISGTGTSGEPESVNVTNYSPFASSRFGRRVGLNLLKWSADERTENRSCLCHCLCSWSGFNWYWC
ncbi:MAG: hypothetical protein ACW981_17970 [Candidatus Hodarchaeales archaeon]|jgi:hypothetical protein